MKTDIFVQAIRNRNNLQFLYGLQEVNIEPYYISKNTFSKKVIYGRVRNTNEIRKFEYYKIANIRIINSFRFSPLFQLILLHREAGCYYEYFRKKSNRCFS